ncbi:MAG: hypothetical protein JNK45_35505 [Myxococcales bacterium]|nr:hypothetical protein [Myxococcales bacterium]
MTRLPALSASILSPALAVALGLPLSLGCHHEKPTTTPVDTAATPAGATGIDAELASIAAKPGVATKFKLRIDASGAIQKQSLYHGDAAAIPEAAKAKALAKWPGSTVHRFETELYAEHGRVHEVEVKTAEGGVCELAVKADGTDLYEECQIAADQLPAAVAAKVTELFPQGKVLEAETKRGPNMDELTIEVESNGQEFYLRVKPDGTVLAKLVRIPGVFEVPVP